MKKAMLVIIWSMLVATSGADAQQFCHAHIIQDTPTADLTDNGDGTITHHPTTLMWKRCLEGLSGVDCTTGAESLMTWQAALQHADGHSYAGHNDWRLPNIKELSSVVESSCYHPSINLSVFPNFPIRPVWSSSPSVSSHASWMVDFSGGESFNTFSRDNSYGVWLVRNAQ